MTDARRERAERAVDQLASESRPEQVAKVDSQFHDKLSRVEAAGHGTPEMIERLRVFWRMLRAPDDAVPWKVKALLMAAVSYFVSPVDLVPDLGRAGYLDDALVVRIVHARVRAAFDAFVAGERKGSD